MLSAHVAIAPRAQLRQSFSRTLRSQKHNIFSMGPKLRYPMVLHCACIVLFRRAPSSTSVTSLELSTSQHSRARRVRSLLFGHNQEIRIFRARYIFLVFLSDSSIGQPQWVHGLSVLAHKILAKARISTFSSRSLPTTRVAKLHQHLFSHGANL